MEFNPQDREQALLSRRSINLSYDPERGVREDGDKRYITFTAASDRPLIRNMFFGPVKETLHFDGLDTTRLEGGHVKLLDTHKSGSIYDQLGNISDFRIKKGSSSQGTKVLEVEAEFDLTRDKQRDAFEGILAKSYSNVSVGYSDLGPGGMKAKWNDERADFDPDKEVVGEIDYKRWEINEISLCSTPADAEIGLGRNANAVHRIELAYARHREELRTRAAETDNIDPESQPQSDTNRSNNMSEQTEIKETAEQATEPAGERAVEKTEAQAQAPARKIDTSGQTYLAREAVALAGKGVAEEFIRTLADKAAEGDGMSEASVKSVIFDHLQEREKEMDVLASGRAPAAHTSDTEDQRRFSAARLLRQTANGQRDGIEREMVRDWEISVFGNRSPSGPAEISSDRGTNLPFKVLMQDEAVRDVLVNDYLIGNDPKVVSMREQLIPTLRSNPYTVGTTNAGYHQVEFSEDFFISALIANAFALGYTNKWAMELTQDYSGIIETNSMSVQDVNPGAETAARTASTGPSYADHKLTWHELYGRLSASQRTFDQSRNFASRLLFVMNRDLFRGVNDRLLNGLTASHQPLGLLAKTGSTTPVVALASNALTWAKLVELRTKVAAANGNINSNCVYVSTPEVQGKIATLARFAGSTGGLSDAVMVNDMIDGFKFVMDNNAPKNLTAGNNRHGILFGDLSTVDYVSFSGVSLVRDDLTGLANGNINFHIRYAYDLLPRNINHFAAAVDVNPA